MCACSHPETDRAPCAHRAARAPLPPWPLPLCHFLHGRSLGAASLITSHVFKQAMRSFSEKDILSLIAKLVLRGVEQIFVGGVAWETTEVFRAQGALEIYMSQQLNDCTS
ncbi:uncharacterized protein [Zea mays]|uniref:uncharacterized protein isoform X2 n=1 Tax=Zea mays TaxID=4577 RepID=UPI000C6C5631|nr:uncharacterized protein LOC111589336 isoform X2 [Zea mays]|eukprot:XP_023155943.1 uncharacterized protein LOC111589336 isoform X1 [Zea mays]